jgi:hypothetical protein
MCDTLTSWIANLYDRLERGDLAAIGLVYLQGWPIALEAELAAKILLADLEDLEDRPADERMSAPTVARRVMLLDDLRQLRERIG